MLRCDKMSSKGKKNATQVRIDEAKDDAGNAGNVPVPVNVNMTFEQQLQLMKCKDEIRERELVRERERAAIERDRAALKEAELRLQQELARAGVGPGVGAANRAFDVSKASSMLPTYSEKDLEMYLSNLEKTAEASAWPKEKWAVILQPKLSGKALKAYDKLSVNDLNDYEIVKEAILDELELVAEVYRVRFRHSIKRPTETYCDYANFMTVQFDRWLKCTDITNFYGLRQLMLIEKFCEAVPQDLRVHLVERNLDTVLEVAKAADEYTVLRRGAAKSNGYNKKNVATKFIARGEHNGNGAGDRHDGNARNGHVTSSSNNGKSWYGKNTQVSDTSNKEQILCYYCQKPGHRICDCDKRKQEQTSAVFFLKNMCMPEDRVDCNVVKSNVNSFMNEYIVPITVHNVAGDNVELSCWRDTGAQISLLMEGCVPSSCLQMLDETECVTGVVSNDIVEVPMCAIEVSSNIVNGVIKVALAPASFGIPNKNIPFLLGNDYGPRLSFCVDSPVSVKAVTRRQHRLELESIKNNNETENVHSSVQCNEGNEIITDDDKSDVTDVIDNSSEMSNVLSSAQNLFNSVSDSDSLSV